MRSLRGRLFLYLIGGVALLLLAAGLVVRAMVSSRLEHEFDLALEAKARALAAITEQEAGRIELDVEDERVPEFGWGTGAEYFELWRVDGALLRRSASFAHEARMRDARLVRTVPPSALARFQDLRLPDGRWGRQVQIDFTPTLDQEADSATVPGATVPEPAPPGLPTATLIVARERERLDADARRLDWALAGAGACLLLALVGLTHLALAVGLRSLEQLTRQVRALDVSALGTRVYVDAPPEEVSVVIDQVNALLDRLEAAFRRERRLSSDIAHELRTPIAELRTLCDVGARWPGDRVAVRRFFGDARAIALQMDRVVRNLLALARHDGGSERVSMAPVAVAEIVDAAWTPLARDASVKDLELRRQIPSDLRLETDPDKFALIVSNLLSNAVAYSPRGTSVVCVGEQTNGRASVSFSNRAENLDADDLPLMFDRFWRKDAARTDGTHAGLGLALVRALAELLGIVLATDLSADKTFRVTLSGPVGGEDANGGDRMSPSAQEVRGSGV